MADFIESLPMPGSKAFQEKEREERLRIEALRAASRLWGGLLSNENVEPTENVEAAMLASADRFYRWLKDG